jgi:hypothetical protein
MSVLPTIATLPPAPSRSDDSDTFVAKADAFLAALDQLVSDINGWSAAVPGLVNPANFDTTSSTSVAIGTGSKSLTVEAGKLFYTGQWLLATSTASPSNYMVGQVTSYNATTGALVLNVSYTSGSGTIASWTVGPVTAPATTVNPRTVTSGTTTGTITPDSANADLYIVNGATGALTFAAPSGTPVGGQKLMLRFKDNGTSRALSWNATYRPFGSVALPSATTVGKWHYIACIWNANDSAWDVIGAAVQQ